MNVRGRHKCLRLAALPFCIRNVLRLNAGRSFSFMSYNALIEAPEKENNRMSALTKFYVKNRERLSRMAKGQTMTEYALILAAVAIVVFITYEVMGQDTGKLVNNV